MTVAQVVTAVKTKWMRVAEHRILRSPDAPSDAPHRGLTCEQGSICPASRAVKNIPVVFRSTSRVIETVKSCRLRTLLDFSQILPRPTFASPRAG
jgi:hypothetical protein